MRYNDKKYLKQMAKSFLNEAIRSGPVQELKRELNSILSTDDKNNADSVYTPPDPPPPRPPVQPEYPRRNTAPVKPAAEKTEPVRQTANPPAIRPKVPAVHAGGLIMALVGLIAIVPLSLFDLAVLFMLINALADPMSAAGAITFMTPLIAGSVFLIAKGFSLMGRNKRLRAYWREIGSSEICPISLLASSVKEKKKFVTRDLQKLIRLGKMPGAQLDKKKTCLILNARTYEQVQRAEEAARLKQEAEDQAKNEVKKPVSEVEAAIADGAKFIRQINEMNALIPGEALSRKIDHLERVTAKIFQTVEQHPEKLPEIRKFMSYYLPTTLKLLASYHEFQQQPIQGENILQVQREISGALNTVCAAFDNLLDSLFEDAVFDISTDISVLETMLAQEGLTGGNDFKNEKQTEK